MNSLEHLDEFKKILGNYTIADKGRQVLGDTKLALLAAPTSSGRNTIIRKLQETQQFHFLVSDTTRHPRVNDGLLERSGVEYWFRNEEDVLDDLKKGKYLEAALVHNQQVSGISLREIEKARRDNKIAVTDIEIAGVDTIMKIKSDALAFFILPPDFDEWQRRIRNRGNMDIEEFRRRLESACSEFEAALNRSYYIFVVNDSLESAAKQIYDSAVLSVVDIAQQHDGIQLATRLLQDTRNFIKNNYKFT